MHADSERGLRVQLAAALRELAGAKDRAEAWHNKCDAAESERDALRGENGRLRAMLDLATTRIEILLGRMRGCDAEVADGRRGQNAHELSLFEGEGWIGEQRAALAGGGDRG